MDSPFYVRTPCYEHNVKNKMARNESQQYDSVVLRRCAATVLLLRVELPQRNNIGLHKVMIREETTPERAHPA